jgi:ABC-type Na+ efflux pump permease subunit
MCNFGKNSLFRLLNHNHALNQQIMDIYNILDRAHSGLRWVVLLLLIAAIADAYRRAGAKEASLGKLALFAFIFTHVQLLLGLTLYFISPMVQFSEATMKDSVLRFYTVEHITGMLIAIALITVGYSKGKRMLPDAAGHKRIANFYLIALLLILLSIPWPFRNLGAGWY